jgi:ubiquitin-conjugating enzyme E2 variant
MSQGSSQIQQRDGSALREGYGSAVRRFEIASIVCFAAAMAWLLLRLADRLLEYPFLAASAFMLGFVAADLTSGIVHWLADTWGSVDLPFVGRALIRPFREHHVDPKAITRHDFVETNGNNCFICLPPVTLTAAFVSFDDWRGVFAGVLVFSLCLWIFCTNQFHKWSHSDDPPAVVVALQRLSLILPRDHHAVHHSAPFATYYCITVGWLNEPLHRIGFFRGLERLISATTGLLPREDDIGRSAAERIVEESEICPPAATNPEPG